MKRQYAILEYDRIIKLLAERTSSALGAAEAEALLPVSHPHEIRRRLRETAEAVFVVMQKGSPGIGNFGDISQAVAYADRGGSLTPAQLLSVAVQLTAARRAAAFLKPGGAQREHHREEHNRDGSFRATASRKHSEDASFDAAAPGAPGAGGGFPGTPILSEIASVITVRKDLEDRISASILSDTEIADSASAELRRIRRQIITQSENIRAQLNKLISSSSYKDVLQDQIITQRDGRWVVPVKQESTKSVPGIIHDRSKGGATVFIEPQSVVNANNALRELEIQERQEIDRILAELSAFVAESAEELRLNQDMLVRIDFIFAKGLLAADMKASEPLISEMSGSLCINQSFADPPFAGQSFTDSPLADPPIVGSSYAGLPSATRTDSSPSRSPILEIENGRHPLIDPDDVVPISLTLGGAYNTLIITGPNTGGKTVTLKSVGLFVLMAQAGLHIPASRAVIPAVKKVFADIGDEQSIEQSLSTFSSHMKNIVEIVERADAESIVFFDELGAGTDPTEGAALAISILETLGARGCLVMATTHYTELKKYALAADGVENASMEFDIETLSPTYRLRVGLPGRSNAFEISRKLGLPEDVVSRAAQRMDSGSIAFETVIEQAESNRQAAEKARRDAENTLSEIEEEREALDKEVRTFEEKRTELLEKARDKSVKKIAEANEYADIIKAELKAILDEAGDLIEQAKASALSAEEAKSAPSRGDFYRRLDENRKMLKQLDGEFRNIGNAKDSGSGKGNGSGSDNGYRRDNGKGNGSSSGSGSGNSNSRKARSSSGFGSGRKLSYRSSAQTQSRLEKDDVRIGDTVRFVTLDAEGQVTTLPDDKGELQILVGRIRMTVPLSELRAVRGGNPDKNTRDGRSSGGARSGKNKKASSRGLYSARLPGVSGATQIQLSKANTISSSIDLHGQTLDDAIMIADKYIDDAMLAGFGEVSLVHGRGEGILRAGLRQMLRSHKHVKKVRSGGPDEGGDGATIVTLK